MWCAGSGEDVGRERLGEVDRVDGCGLSRTQVIGLEGIKWTIK